MKALLFGSIGTLVETSEIQRQAYNQAFKDVDLNWYWNVATYCKLLLEPGGIKRLKNYSKNQLSNEIINTIHSKKEQYFETSIKQNLCPREGVIDIINFCVLKNIKLGFITSTSKKNINSIKNALVSKIDFSKFELITSINDVKNPKPESDVYKFALNTLNITENEAIVIEDTIINQKSALSLGIKCLLFPGEYAQIKNSDNAIYKIEEEIKLLL